MFKGKAGSLQFLKDQSFSVPEWKVITHDEFISWGETSKLEEFKLILGQHQKELIPVALDNFLTTVEVPERYLSFQNSHPLLAVRSSASVEDSPDHSFAGIFETKLFIAKNLSDAIKEVWLSLYTETALSYCMDRQVPWTDLQMDIILQEMVNGEKSGVLFQADPLGKLNNQVINAGFGLGQGIVDDTTETDRYLVTNHQVTKKEINFKENHVLFDEQSQKVIIAKTPAELSLEPVLSHLELYELIQISKKIESLTPYFLDLEFTIRDEKIYLLQARPITTLPPKEFIHVFDNSNIAENYPGQSLPLTFATLQRAYSINFRNLLSFVGFPEKERAEIDNKLDHLVAYWGGHIYYNLNNWYEIFALLPFGSEKATSSFNEMVGISAKSPGRTKRKSFATKLKVMCKILPRFLTYFFTTSSYHSQYKKEFSLFYHEYIHKTDSMKDLFEILHHCEEMDRQFLSIIKIPLFNDFFSSLLHKSCRGLITNIGGDEGDSLHNDLLSHREDLESSKAIYSLLALSDIVRKNPELHIFLNNHEKELTPLEDVLDDSPFDYFNQKLQDHFYIYGDRAQWEMKLETPTAREIPWTTLKLILQYAKSDVSVEAQKAKERAKSHAAEAKIKNLGKKKPLNSLLFWWIFKKSSEAISFREDARFDRVRANGLARKIYLKLGLVLLNKKRLDSVDDIFYLSTEEVSSLKYDSYGEGYLKELVALRKKYLSMNQDLKLPDRIIINDLWPVTKFNEASEVHQSGQIQGVPCSSGEVSAPCEVVRDLSQVTSLNGKILVAERTDPSWGYFFVGVKGIIIEKGSMLSHAAIISRELGIPCIINVKDATTLLKTGTMISMNGHTGEIKIT